MWLHGSHRKTNRSIGNRCKGVAWCSSVPKNLGELVSFACFCFPHQQARYSVVSCVLVEDYSLVLIVFWHCTFEIVFDIVYFDIDLILYLINCILINEYCADFECMVLLSIMANGFTCLITFQEACPCWVDVLFCFVFLTFEVVVMDPENYLEICYHHMNLTDQLCDSRFV